MYHRYSHSGNKRRKLSLIIKYILVIIVLLIAYYIYKSYNYSTVDHYGNIINDASKRYSIDPMLIKAVIWRESDFKKDAVGKKGEIGLMQLMTQYSVKDWSMYTDRKEPSRGLLFNPQLNIEIGTWYLAQCKKHWKNYQHPIILALAEYNAGYSNVKKWIPKDFKGNPLKLIKFPSTKKYVETILDKYHEYKN